MRDPILLNSGGKSCETMSMLDILWGAVRFVAGGVQGERMRGCAMVLQIGQ